MPPRKIDPAEAGGTQGRRRTRQSTASVEPGDEPLLETPGGRAGKPDPEDVLPDTPEDEGAPDMDVGAEPRSAVTGRPVPGSGEETEDGLDETEERVRRAAERRPLRPSRG